MSKNTLKSLFTGVSFDLVFLALVTTILIFLLMNLRKLGRNNIINFRAVSTFISKMLINLFSTDIIFTTNFGSK